MKTLKVKLLTGRTGSAGSNIPGESIDVPVLEAIALVESDQANPVNKQAYEEALKPILAQREAELEREAQIKAIKEKDKLKVELNSLAGQIVVKAAEVNGKHLSDSEIVEGVETLLGMFLEERQSEETKQGFFGSLFFGKK